MIKSMTGFGRAQCAFDDYTITAEIKSVNHRYFEFSARVPRAYGFLEETLKNIKSLSEEKTDTIILADGAYLLIRDELREKLPAVTTLIFPHEEAAKYVYSNLMCSDCLSERENTENNIVFCAENNSLTDDECAKFVKRKSELIKI